MRSGLTKCMISNKCSTESYWSNCNWKMLSAQYYLSMPLKQDWRIPQRMHFVIACKLSSVNCHIKKEIVISCGDWNGHIGSEAAGYKGVHGRYRYGERNADGDRVLDFAVANDFVIGNSFLDKGDSHLITYHSGNAKTQIDFILFRKRNPKMIKKIRAIPSEECAPQHKLLTCELRLKTPKPHHSS